ncbi:hypothetical protein DFH08DRAFT_922643 [Mycena albidolilacea]|uniref:non-specific serine/threonine protein kinase n=1 Tax=Mycena albidolilacea TaxID=1033008 RepID=A0AAD7EZ45_9AGAR|nr:hypothetical protein DFH08DRAFT_922643 [Mycena albidolilacea]
MKSSALRNIPGGFHPISIGGISSGGRYKVIYKLGFGGFATVWLACDREREPGTPVTLKAMATDASSKFPAIFPKYTFSACFILPADSFQTVKDNFQGKWQPLTSYVSGSPARPKHFSHARLSGTSIWKPETTGRFAKECSTRNGRDLTTSNIIFRFSEEVLTWSDDAIYRRLGSPQIEEVKALAAASFLKETVVVIGFGQSYVVRSPPGDYQPGTTMCYLALEALGRAGFEADIWALARAIFELRAEFQLFESFLGSDTDILRQTVEVLGRLPDPWWASFEERIQWFEDDGEPKSAEAQKHAGVLLQASRSLCTCEAGYRPDSEE